MKNELTEWQRRQFDHSIKVVQRFGIFSVQRRNSSGRWNDIPSLTDIRGLRQARKLLEEYKKTKFRGRPSDLRTAPKIVSNTQRETRNAEFGRKRYVRPKPSPTNTSSEA